MAHAYIGVHILQRGIIFVDLSLSQFIGLGIAFSFFLGEDDGTRLIFSLGFAVLGAFILSFSRQISRFVHIEAFIGGPLHLFSLGEHTHSRQDASWVRGVQDHNER